VPVRFMSITFVFGFCSKSLVRKNLFSRQDEEVKGGNGRNEHFLDRQCLSWDQTSCPIPVHRHCLSLYRFFHISSMLRRRGLGRNRSMLRQCGRMLCRERRGSCRGLGQCRHGLWGRCGREEAGLWQHRCRGRFL